MIVAVLAALGFVLVLTSGVWDQAIQNSGTSAATVRSLVSTVKVVTVVIGVISLALYLFFAIKMRAGRNWARIVLTVLSALSLLSSFSASASVTINDQVFTATSSRVTEWIGVALSVVAIVLMYLTPSNLYFTASNQARPR